MWLNNVATSARVVEVVLHIEFHGYLARRARLGKALVAQQASRSRRASSHTRVRVELLVTRLLVALKTMIACLARRSVSQETRVVKTVLLRRILALVSDVMTSRAGQFSVFQKCAKIFTNALSVDSNIGRVPARKRTATITMTSCAQCLGVTFVQVDIAGDRRGIDMASLASVLIPVRIILRQCITAEH